MSKGRSIFSGMTIFSGKRWHKNQAVIVEDGKITAIIDEAMIAHHLPATEYQYSSEHYLVPGFIDMHIHGAGGADVMDATPEALNTISQKLASEGVTGFLATTMTASTEQINAALAVIPKVQNNVTGATILGVHLEGPFISREKMGAQADQHICPPNIELVQQWQEISGNAIRLITLAPEYEEALAFIAAIKEMNIIPSIGHSNATYEQTMNAVKAGCNHATHLFNAMRPLQQREPGVVGALLLAKNVMAELILDGHHLHPAICQLALQMKGIEHLVLVSDAMRAKCMKEGDYDLGGQMVNVKDGKALLSNGALAGSVLTIPKAIKNMVKFTDCKLEEAIVMATENPARQLKLFANKGSIEVGKDADLVILNKDLKVMLTIREGNVVFNARP